MLVEEAKWFGAWLAQSAAERLSPMLNVGSQTLHFRRFVQPWIEQYIFGPLQQRGITVMHTDLRPGAGVDIVGDLTDLRFIHRLQSCGFRSLFCSNLLEHVPQPVVLAHRLVSLLPVGGLLFVSCPRVFPYHPDPVDTWFRPDVDQLTNLFPQTRLVAGEIVDCGPLWHYVVARLRTWSRRRYITRRSSNKPSRDLKKSTCTLESPHSVLDDPDFDIHRDETGQATWLHYTDKELVEEPLWRRVLRLAVWLCRPVSATCAVLEVVPVWQPASELQKQPCVS